MTNKLWYEKISTKDSYIRTTLQEYIDLYFSDSIQFKIVEDITLENLNEFLEIILKHYQQYHFHATELFDIGETLEYYFDYVYMNEEREINYPEYDNEDRRKLAILMLDYMQMIGIPKVLHEDVPYLIEFLHANDGEVTQAREKLDTYLTQFDLIKINLYQ